MRKRWIAAGLLGLAVGGLYVVNASWRAPAPQGRLTLVAQRGVASRIWSSSSSFRRDA